MKRKLPFTNTTNQKTADKKVWSVKHHLANYIMASHLINNISQHMYTTITVTMPTKYQSHAEFHTADQNSQTIYRNIHNNLSKICQVDLLRFDPKI